MLTVIGISVVFSYIHFNMDAIARLTVPEQMAFSLFWTLDVWMWHRPQTAMSYA